MKRGTIGFAVALDPEVCAKRYVEACTKLGLDEMAELDDVNGWLDMIERLYPSRQLRDERMAKLMHKVMAEPVFRDNKQLGRAFLYSVAMRRAKL
jgi:hypothetical protein